MSYTNVSDKAVRKLGLRDGYVLSLVHRHCQMKDGVFKAGKVKKAKSLKISPNLLRRALNRLLADEYILDLTPNLKHKPHEYIATPKGCDLCVGRTKVFQNGSPETGVPKRESRNRSPEMEHKEYSSKESTTTTDSINTVSSSTQAVLIENHNQQNLGALDIQAQDCLEALGIRPDLKQPFRAAPDLVKNHTPAEVLMFHDPQGDISENLGRWRAAWDDGATIADKPALIWAKIVEGQAPPQPEQREPNTWYAGEEEWIVT